jgi:transposase
MAGSCWWSSSQVASGRAVEQAGRSSGFDRPIPESSAGYKTAAHRQRRTGRVLSLHLRSGGLSGQCAPDGLSSAGWNDLEIDSQREFLAHRIIGLTAEVDELQARITKAVNTSTPRLLERNGIGPDSAAALLITAGDNPERLHSEASFAALCGSSPIEASSGKTHRRRLNRGGDRQANAALYRIALSRLRWDPRTRDYVDRRIAEGKPPAKRSAASSATSPARSTRSSSSPDQTQPRSPQPLDIHRAIRPKRRYQRTAKTMTSGGKQRR